MSDTQKHINEDVKDDIARLYDHAKVANEEMGAVKEHIAMLETDMKWVKGILEKVDTRTWIILSTIIFGIIVQIALKIYG